MTAPTITRHRARATSTIRRPSGAIPWLLLVVALVPAVAGVVYLRADYWSFTDLRVYRQGGDQMLYGISLYGDRPGLPFTYPPFAAILFIPLYLVSHAAAVIALSTLSALAYVVFAGVAARRLGLDRWATAGGIVLGFAFEPIWHTFALGQINLLLAAVIILDCVVVPDPNRGWLVGVAAGVDLVPGIFVLYFLLRRNWAAAARSLGGLAVTILVSAVVAPHDTWLYWTKLVYRPDHVGGLAYVGNQSLNGDLIRLSRNEHPPTAAYAALALVAVVVAVGAAYRQLQAGQEIAAVTCIALGGLLASPVSWTHHWVWLLPASAILAVRRDWPSCVFVGAVAIVAPMWFAPATNLREFHHNPVQAACCLAYAGAAVCFLARMLWSKQSVSNS